MVNERIIQFVCLFIAVLIATLYLNSLKNKPKEIEIKGIENIVIYLNNEKNNLILVNNDTVKELINILPIESQITKEEMYLSLELDRELSSNDKVTKVEKGDVVLFKNKTIRIFTKDSNVEEEYTKLGKILLVDKLDNINEEEIIVRIKKD